jgi:dUTP pyrophosphatase
VEQGSWSLDPEHAGLPVQVVRLDTDLPLPSYAHPGDAGADLLTSVDVSLAPGERCLVPTGIALAVPTGYVALVHPRSGLAAKHGLSIVNTPGTIDAGYRGEIKVLLVNHDLHEPIELRRGDRVAQLVFQRVEQAVFEEVDVLDDSSRGTGGYGSTGGFASREPGTERSSEGDQ